MSCTRPSDLVILDPQRSPSPPLSQESDKENKTSCSTQDRHARNAPVEVLEEIVPDLQGNIPSPSLTTQMRSVSRMPFSELVIPAPITTPRKDNRKHLTHPPFAPSSLSKYSPIKPHVSDGETSPVRTSRTRPLQPRSSPSRRHRILGSSPTDPFFSPPLSNRLPGPQAYASIEAPQISISIIHQSSFDLNDEISVAHDHDLSPTFSPGLGNDERSLFPHMPLFGEITSGSVYGPIDVAPSSLPTSPQSSKTPDQCHLRLHREKSLPLLSKGHPQGSSHIPRLSHCPARTSTQKAQPKSSPRELAPQNLIMGGRRGLAEMKPSSPSPFQTQLLIGTKRHIEESSAAEGSQAGEQAALTKKPFVRHAQSDHIDIERNSRMSRGEAYSRLASSRSFPSLKRPALSKRHSTTRNTRAPVNHEGQCI